MIFICSFVDLVVVGPLSVATNRLWRSKANFAESVFSHCLYGALGMDPGHQACVPSTFIWRSISLAQGFLHAFQEITFVIFIIPFVEKGDSTYGSMCTSGPHM